MGVESLPKTMYEITMSLDTLAIDVQVYKVSIYYAVWENVNVNKSFKHGGYPYADDSDWNNYTYTISSICKALR